VERIEWLEDYDPAQPPPPGYIHHIRGEIHELRRLSNGRQYRFLYARLHSARRIVLLHALVKKTEALDNSDIALAEQRLGDYRSRGLA
jgi:phage-related protein